MDSFFIFINKPVGMTSQKCLTILKKRYLFKKIGHNGTLDPFACGLLLVGVNGATKFFSAIKDEEKTYEAVVKLGEETDTLDRDGVVVGRQLIPPLSFDAIREVAKAFLGKQKQIPPLYSAVKVRGKEAYKWARQGQTVTLAPREIFVHDLKILSWEDPFLKFEATVTRGTYVRVLACDLAKRLGSVGHLVALTRTRLCGATLSDASGLDDDVMAKKIPIESLLGDKNAQRAR